MMRDSMNAQISKLLRIHFIDGHQVVAGRAVVTNALSILRIVASVVTAETARIVIMSGVIRMCAPGNLHGRKHILTIEIALSTLLASSIWDLLLAPDVRILRAIKAFQASRDL